MESPISGQAVSRQPLPLSIVFTLFQSTEKRFFKGKNLIRFPLVVDLDGTLLKSDVLLETILLFVRQYPFKVFKLLAWLLGGKPCLKGHLARITALDVGTLPYDAEVIAQIKAERETGRTIVLATATHHVIATRIAKHLGVFDQVFATNSGLNLSATKKRDLLVERFGLHGFDYLGNSSDDLPVWAAARKAFIVDASRSVIRKANAHGNVEHVSGSNKPSIKVWAKALRLHQWAKNLLVLAPLLSAHRITDPGLLLNGIIAFVLFGLCASSVYILNDLLDLADDRRHKSKYRRPFASGRLSIAAGLAAFPILLIVSFAFAFWLLPLPFAATLFIYYCTTLAYSLTLKRKMALDVVVLAVLYTLRVIAGVAAFRLTLTFWFLAFSIFMFLSLALVKRFTELREARSRGIVGKTLGRGYYPQDLEMISSLGGASGYISILVLALYIRDQATVALYSHPQIIWLACPLLLFWVTRLWLLAHRGLIHDDPVVFALKDKTSLIVAIMFIFVFVAAI